MCTLNGKWSRCTLRSQSVQNDKFVVRKCHFWGTLWPLLQPLLATHGDTEGGTLAKLITRRCARSWFNISELTFFGTIYKTFNGKQIGRSFTGKYLGAETGKEWQDLNCVSKTANTRRVTWGQVGCTYPGTQAWVERVNNFVSNRCRWVWGLKIFR